MVRREVSPNDLAMLEEALYVGLEEGVDALCQLAEPRQDLYMLPRDITAYIQGFRYFIGRSEQQAIDRFRGYLQELEG
jgi:predicted solute-binding protein